MSFNSEYLNYLQRIGLSKLPVDSKAISSGHIVRKLFRLNGYGRLEKQPQRDPGKQSFIPSEDILFGLYRNEIPLAFYIESTPGSLNFYMGSWSPATGDNDNVVQARLNERIDIIKALLESTYPASAITDVEADPLIEGMKGLFTHAGMVLGVPSLKILDSLDGSLQIDRMVRGLSVLNWGYLILAQPVKEKVTNNLRLSVINETKAIQDEIQSTHSTSPLAEYYLQMLQFLLGSFTSALQCGNWRTGVYILGDKKSYNRVSSVFSSTFTGLDSLPESINVLTSPEMRDLAINWALPESAETKGLGLYNHPLKYQTLLNSIQLSGYIHLPSIESRGFQINILPNFDIIPHKTDAAKAIGIGKISRNYSTADTSSSVYSMDINDLTKHVFVSGITGAGKTNTILQILKNAYAFNVPFLVIEPAKTEYRSFLNDKESSLNKDLQIFTPGNELVSPFRLNPFEIVGWPSVTVSVHIDLLRSVFSSSFGMWAPLPQILERCIYDIYMDRGWDITTNKNNRIDQSGNADITEAFPTLSDLAAKVEEAIKQLGYEKTITDNMKAALLTRINGLRIGGKGKMFDVQRSLPMELVLNSPSIFELEGMGDDDDKAFFMGLIFIRLAEYRRAHGSKEELQHLLVIEEAHRLLANVSTSAKQEEANPRGKAVETFSNILSEIRTYGQGVIIADQVPVRLAPDAIKNTNLKIAHRCVAADDRSVLAGAMSMSDAQSISLSSFGKGVAAVFGEGDDAPLLVKIDPVDQALRVWPKDEEVIESVKKSQTLQQYKAYLNQDNGLFSTDGDESSAREIDVIKQICETEEFDQRFCRFVLLIVESEDEGDSSWNNLLSIIPSFLKQGMNLNKIREYSMLYKCRQYAQLRGRQENWTYSKTGALQKSLSDLLSAKINDHKTAPLLAVYREKVKMLFNRTFEPYPGCNRICNQQPATCLYRRTVADYISSAKTNLNDELNNAYLSDISGAEANNSKPDMVEVKKFLDGGAYSIINIGLEDNIVAKRIGLCYGQQVLKNRPLATHSKIMDPLLAEIEL